MKKFLLYLAVFAVFSTSYAVTFTSQYNGDGSFDILYQGQLPVGVALDITLPDGLATDYTSCSVNSYYNLFPDWAYDNDSSTYELGSGHPIADIDVPGSLSGAVSSFCVSMAAFMPYSAYEAGQPIGNLPMYDLDVDGDVDIDDIREQNWDWLHFIDIPDLWMIGDINMDSVVDMRDVGMMNGQQYLDESSSGVLMTIEVHDFDSLVDYGGVGVELNYRGIYEIPEPATLSLLAFGGLTLLRKRK